MDSEMRLTPQRKVILEMLRHDPTHPTADEIYLKVRKKLPHISLSTVYRNLETLSRRGLIRKLEFGAGRKRFDGHCDPHFHVRCESCGVLADLKGEEFPVVAASADLSGFEIWGYHLEFYGLCSNCTAAAVEIGDHSFPKPDPGKNLN